MGIYWWWTSNITVSVLLCNHVQLRIITKILNHGAPGPVIFFINVNERSLLCLPWQSWIFNSQFFYLCVCLIFISFLRSWDDSMVMCLHFGLVTFLDRKYISRNICVVRYDVLNIVGGRWAEYPRSLSLNLLDLAPVHW